MCNAKNTSKDGRCLDARKSECKWYMENGTCGKKKGENMDAYIAQIKYELTKGGFDKLNKEDADDCIDAIRAFISDLAHQDWEPEALGYGG